MFQSTRSDFTSTDTAAVLQGLAPDGGLFVDPSFASKVNFDVKSCLGLRYTDLAEKVISFLMPGFSPWMKEIVSVYPQKFSSPAITPLTKVGENYALELYHGPTSAFKDVALSVLPLFITRAREAEGITDRISILTATSGDTGKAALEGFHDVPGTDITVFFPEEGVSAVQRAQMTTQTGSNVRVCAVRGNFDDCQGGVKAAFADGLGARKKAGRRFSSANSINIGRLVPQVVYYFSAYSQLVTSGALRYPQPVDFVVPTGNFGDILAGYLARQMGLPVGKLVCASNANNVLTDFINTGVYDRNRPFLKTVSPSMDILVSSNLERLLYFASGCSAERVSAWMKALNTEGTYTLDQETLSNIRSVFYASFCSEDQTAETIRTLWQKHHWLCDTHTAVAFRVAEEYRQSKTYTGNPCIILSTASPFKFPVAVLSALGESFDGDDFAAAERLSELTGRPVPENLSSLRSLPVLHRDVVDIADVVSYALR